MSCSPSDSKKLTQCQVVSKYFSGKTVMDESLTEFQEKKKNFSGPKNTQKPKTKAKKPVKKIRGQKDIRTALKLKKNELLAYSNDFDKVCKQSGIDVDPEQLQIAIALSKSLQNTEGYLEDQSSSGSLTLQERTGKIRTTLQEYGFVVPEVKITTARSKKSKRKKENYKLLTITEEERQQVISDRYSKVLFDNFENSKLNPKSNDDQIPNARLYNLVTNISYETIKNNCMFYVKNLLENSSSKIGSLLKDWSQIPGRPTSPICVVPKLDFGKIYCSQEELDSILSGTLKTAQNIARDRYNLITEDCQNIEDKLQENTVNNSKVTFENKTTMKTDDVEIVEIVFDKTAKVVKPTESIDVDDYKLTVTQNIRSFSPDLFDDEVSSIMESSCQNINLKAQEASNSFKTQDVPNKNRTKICEEIMDLTGCVAVNSQRNIEKPMSQLSQGTTNATKRRSNDFMDMTECVTGSSQAIREEIAEQNIDLTQNSDENQIDGKGCKIVEDKVVENMDLTQSSDSNDLPVVQISGTNSMDETIIMNESYSNLGQNVTDTPHNEFNAEVIHNSPILLESPEYNTPEEDKIINPLETGNYVERCDIVNAKNRRAISPINHINSNAFYEDYENSAANNDNSKTLNSSREKSISPMNEPNIIKSKTESLFEEFVHRHSSSSEEEKTDEIICLDESKDKSLTADSTEDIDLTQSFDGSEDNCNKVDPQVFNHPKSKVFNISVDCDEMFDDLVKSHASTSKSISYKSNVTDSNTDIQTKPGTTNSDLASSQNSEVFEISDNELDYSLHKSKQDNIRDNFDFGGISVVDNLADLPSIRKSRTSLNRSMSDSFLPKVDMKSQGQESTIYSPNQSVSEPSKDLIAKTPKNGEYVIKTDQVTPLMNYEAMSTPDINTELDKYGLKPFKRKRAIQLLTHVYNQTHPIVESCSTDHLPSPSKKFKKSISRKKISTKFDKQINLAELPRKGLSPRKALSPRKGLSPIKGLSPRIQANVDNGLNDVADKESNIYDVTNEMPDIRDLGSSENDWVFQKREKAKVHSCRVPLHIAFHNYVSSRYKLREAILRYEPVNIDVIHKGLVANGFRYDPKDLLKFLDKKCITVKTADNNARNNKKH